MNTRRIGLSILAAVLGLALLCGCAKQPEPPEAETPDPAITVTLNGAEVPYSLGYNQWGGAVFDRVDTWSIYKEEHGAANAPAVSIGDTIEITFADRQPDQIQLQGFVAPGGSPATFFGASIDAAFQGGVGSFIYSAELESAIVATLTPEPVEPMPGEEEDSDQTQLEQIQPRDQDPGAEPQTDDAAAAEAADSLRGFMLVVVWGEDSCEYVFLLNAA